MSPEPEPEDVGTEYVVLASPDNEAWTVVGRAQARSAEKAIEAVIVKLLDGGEIDAPHPWHVAVPVRSWAPKRIQAERQTKVTFG